MAKRSRRSRRTSAPRQTTQPKASAASAAAPAVSAAAEAAQAEEDFVQDYDYVYGDLRILLVVSVGMILLMIGLSYFF